MKNLIRWPVLWWLRFWAILVLRRVRPVIIGVTGSAGKSSTVAAIGPLAQLKYPHLKIAQKANSESGIPADILGLHFHNYSLFEWLRICLLAPYRFTLYALRFTPAFPAYLVEMGVDDPRPPKNMEFLLTILKPHIAVILNALPVHSQQFGDYLKTTNRQDIALAVASEKGKIVTDNDALTHAILNADQPSIARLSPISKSAGIITFGASQFAHVRLQHVRQTLLGTTITLQYQNKNYVIRLKKLALPDYFGHTLAAAFALAIALGIGPQDTARILSDKFILPPGRGHIFPGIKNTLIIDSSYNSSRGPTIGSLKLMKQIAGKRKVIAVLGDMRELGNQAEAEHEAVANTAAETSDQVILIGSLTRKYMLPILSSNSTVPAKWFPTAGKAAVHLQQTLQGGELLLVKGSQNAIFLEIIVEALLADKSDTVKLCRRGAFWDKQRTLYT